MYNILILGSSSLGECNALTAALESLLHDSGIERKNVTISENSRSYISDWSPKIPTALACFNDLSEDDINLVSKMVSERVPIIPVVRENESFDDIHDLIKPLNGIKLEGDNPNYIGISTVLLEALGLLRDQRRVFISYRRQEASEVAVQLHDMLSGNGFSVFLDTHSIRPGRVFQENLWHDLSDSDVVIMLDTPDYFQSKWTREEFGRALALGIHLLRVVWPRHIPMNETGLSETIFLEQSDFEGDILSAHTLTEIAEHSEKLRARSIAARHIDISGKLLAEVLRIGGNIAGAGAYRTISVQLSDQTDTWVYPVVGVPTAPVMNQVARWATIANHVKPFIVYDHQGIADHWLEHMDWLNERIPEVDFLRVANAGEELRQRESP